MLSHFVLYGGRSATTSVIPDFHEGSTMGEFVAQITKRFREAHASLHAARRDGDDILVEARLAEIEDLQRLAARNDVSLPGCP